MNHSTEFKLERFKDILDKVLSDFNLKVILSGLSFVGEFIFKAHQEALLTVFLLIILDTVTGLIKAAKKQDVASRDFFRVTVKLVIYSILMAVASLVDKALPVAMAMPVMYTFLAATEGLSIVENIKEAGYPVPTKIVDILKVSKEDAGKKNE
jgi:toxin secretion/phage lysis holin